MRIIGTVEHPVYKITIFEMNSKVSVKFEDQTLEQTYKFRDGTGINSPEDIANLLSISFMKKIDGIFSKMKETYFAGLDAMSEDEDLSFEII